MKILIYSQEDLDLILSLKTEEKDKQIERLNNIINELEKYIKENSWYYNTSDGCQWVNQFKVLDKLKELKESGNNE